MIPPGMAGPSDEQSWTHDLGLAARGAPDYFRSAADVDSAAVPVPQAHAIRRAFAELKLDGVFCVANAPTAYFKWMHDVDPGSVRELQRRAWNQGLAPVLVIVSKRDVHIYSSLALPARDDNDVRKDGRWIQTLDRATQLLSIRELVTGIESGEFFRIHAASFDPERRVDRRLLANLGDARRRLAALGGESSQRLADALLCRIVFVCYLIDRGIIDAVYLGKLGARNANSLVDILSLAPAKARSLLYRLFEQLQKDFNGDLFGADLVDELNLVTEEHVDVIHNFLTGEELSSGQLALGFWAYDFSLIPIETISAIYEAFLKAYDADAQAEMGAYYTPRFLAEVVLDTALDGLSRWHEGRFLDPACGSGIFLVGLFHRLAEQWRREHPSATYAQHVDALIHILTHQLCGVDRNATACRVAAFSLYVALLDQLAPPAIRKLQERGRWLPRLVHDPEENATGTTLLHADFAFAEPGLFDVIVGNPPWVSRTKHLNVGNSPLLAWCAEHGKLAPQKQIAFGFIWKAPTHLKSGGRVCFVLPHGVLFNHDDSALAAQRMWFCEYPPNRIVNLSDLRFLLFSEAIHPALVVRYNLTDPSDDAVEYFVPKADMSIARAELLTLAPEDRVLVDLRRVLDDLSRSVVPTVWKERVWGSPRDWRFLERLHELPRLADVVDQAEDREALPKKEWKRWFLAGGFQPLGDNDDPETSKPALPQKFRLLKGSSKVIDLLLVSADCPTNARNLGRLRRCPSDLSVFEAPHVIITKGLKVAYANFDVAFQDFARAIHGPRQDANILMFLAAYLRSRLARYYLFHTAAIWGAGRTDVRIDELLQVPFLTPENHSEPELAKMIVTKAARIVEGLMDDLEDFGRAERIADAHQALRPLVERYFGVDENERVLLADTEDFWIKSATPTATAAPSVPTIALSAPGDRMQYAVLLCQTLNEWARRGSWRFDPKIYEATSVAVVAINRSKRSTNVAATPVVSTLTSTSEALIQKLMHLVSEQHGAVTWARGVKVFVDEQLYILKPLAGRFWTRTAALNDADDLLRAILMPGSDDSESGGREARLTR
jgi:hypothetical protein